MPSGNIDQLAKLPTQPFEMSHFTCISSSNSTHRSASKDVLTSEFYPLRSEGQGPKCLVHFYDYDPKKKIAHYSTEIFHH